MPPGFGRALWADLYANWPVYLVALATFGSGLLGILQVLLVRFSNPPPLFSIILPFGLHH